MQAALELCLHKQLLPRSATLQLIRARLIGTGAGGPGAAPDASVTGQHAEASAGSRNAVTAQEQSQLPSASEPALGLLDQQRMQERLQRKQHDLRLQEGGAAPSELASAGASRQSGHMVRLARLGCAISRRDVRRFFKDFDIDDNSIRPQYNWGSHVVKAYWVFFKTEAERRRALAMSGRYLGPHPAMILREEDAHELSQAMQRAPGASHSRGRTALVENLSYSTSLSGLLRQFEGFHLQEHAATLLEGGASEQHKGERVSERASELRDRRKGVPDMRLPSKKMAHRQADDGRLDAAAEKKSRAVVRFKTTEEAYRAVRQMNRTYVTNDCISMRVLY